MRVTFGTKYNQMDYYQNTLQRRLQDANTKIASGLKLKYGYEDSSLFNQNLKMEYDIHALNQFIDIANDANTHTLHTDKSLSEISKTLDDFKVKLLHAANDIHSPTSRNAIANDLEALRNHILAIANTEIGGEYIFAGSNIKVKPFKDDGTYTGNAEKLEALIAPEVKSAYNLQGIELFHSRDLDKFKKITANTQRLNQSKLHPDIMDKMNKTQVPSEVFITEEDTLRDLIGDNDFDTTNDEAAYFYLRGRRPDGTSFKAKFALDVAFNNPQSATRVSDLLRKIGEAYGNTSQNKVVDVTLSKWGQIEITETKPGGSNIDFNLIAANRDVDDINTLHQIGARVTSFQKSPFLGDFSLSQIHGIKDNYDARYTTLGVEFVTHNNQYANKQTKLSEIFGVEAEYVEISGKYPNAPTGFVVDSAIKPFRVEIANSNVGDLIREIERNFGGDIQVEISNGKINIIDNNVGSLENDQKEPPFNGPSGLAITLRTLDSEGNERNAIRNSFQSNYDKTAFTHKGSSLLSNVAQVNALSGEYATDSTKLSEVANRDLNGERFIMKLKDHNGIDIEAAIELGEDGSYLVLPNHNNRFGDFRIPLYNPHDRPPAISITDGNSVTFRQIMDAMTIALNYSNPEIYKFIDAQGSSIIGVSESGKKAYEQLLEMGNRNLSVFINNDGQIEIQDKIRSLSRMSFMIYSESSDDFSEAGIENGAPPLTFNANNALTIDKPHISFFKQLDMIIDAVRSGIYRPDALGDNYNADLRNIGIQNSIALFDHLKDHIEKNIALNGSYGKVFENSIRRNEVLKVQVESIKSDTIGTDIAETYNKFAQLTNNYNAVLASTSKVNQMSLVDYLK